MKIEAVPFYMGSLFYLPPLLGFATCDSGGTEYKHNLKNN